MSSSRNGMVLLALLAGCNPVWKHGLQLAEQGRTDLACAHWNTVLAEDPTEPGARRGLLRYGEACDAEWLEQARALSAESRFGDAIATYDALLAFRAGLEAQRLLTYEPDPAAVAEAAVARTALAKQHYAAGTTSLDAGRFEEALASFETARGLDPELSGIDARVADAWFAWGQADLAAHRYTDAVTRFDTAFAAGHAGARAWSAETSAAIGRYYLGKGGCRLAVAALDAADAAIRDPLVDQDLARARDCARVELLVYTVELGVETPLPTTDLGTLSSDRLAEALAKKASPHVRLMEPTAALESTPPSAGKRYLVRGRLTQLELTRSDVSRDATGPGVKRELCPGIEGYYVSAEEWCDEPVTVTWKEDGTKLALRVGGSVRAVEVGTGTQTLNRTLYLDSEHSAVKATGFQVGGVPVVVAAAATTGVIGVPAELIARQTPDPLPSDLTAMSGAVSRFAEDAATAILETVDVEPRVDPPVRLDIRAPILGPDDIRVKGGTITSQPLPGTAPVPAPPPEPPIAPTP